MVVETDLLTTPFTKLVGCKVPIQQAGMGPLANPKLVSAVTNAGALGMLSGMVIDSVDLLERVLREVKDSTTGPFGVNYIVPLMERGELEQMVPVAARYARVVEFFYGWPDESLVQMVHQEKTLVSWQVGSKEEAKAAADTGCDLIVAQGIEAGGHIRGQIGLLPLLSETIEAIGGKVPIIGAGGIGTGRSMAGVLAAGASAVRVGTRFVASEEAQAHPDYVNALVNAEAKDTIYTDRFNVEWPIRASHRVLRSSLEAASNFKGEVVGTSSNIYTQKKYDIHCFEEAVPMKHSTGNIEAMPHWAGESVGGVKRLQPASEIVRELNDDAEKTLIRWGNKIESQTVQQPV
ncbi:MAG: hypothetical protein AUI50_03385 [Crenarchaeota archaeon 13_1_40CM_2_52_14]|nr:MAG: hypothetical protein AUI50_03385 [Crenarchaeota archaeon 13_1_40CM_2_52_14]